MENNWNLNIIRIYQFAGVQGPNGKRGAIIFAGERIEPEIGDIGDSGD